MVVIKTVCRYTQRNYRSAARMKVPVAVSLLVVCLRTLLAAPVIHPGAGNLRQELQQLDTNKELGIIVQDKIYQSQLPSWDW